MVLVGDFGGFGGVIVVVGGGGRGGGVGGEFLTLPSKS